MTKFTAPMNKATLALKISEKLGVQKRTAEDFIAAFQDIVIESLQNDEEVTIAGFGTFSSRIRSARKGVNPRNPSEMIHVPAVKVPKFKAGKKLKDELKASMASSNQTDDTAATAPTQTHPPTQASEPIEEESTNEAPPAAPTEGYIPPPPSF